MKKLLCILLLLGMLLPALAEENPFAPYGLTAPEGVALEEGETSCTFVSGSTRAVAMVLSRVPDEDPADAILRLMAQFEPDAAVEEEFVPAEGFVALIATTADRFGKGIDLHTAMVLSDAGDLFILACHDLAGDNGAAQTLLKALLTTLTAGDATFTLPADGE